jgi:hypothetical protein
MELFKMSSSSTGADLDVPWSGMRVVGLGIFICERENGADGRVGEGEDNDKDAREMAAPVVCSAAGLRV